MQQESLKHLWVAACCCCLGSVSFGYVIGYSSPAVPDMEWQGVLEKSQLSWFSSIVAIGAIPGCLISSFLSEALGRKQAIIASVVPYVIGWLSIMVASAPFVFYVGRFLTGLATGIVSTVVPIYLAEISNKDVRGLLGAMNQLGITLGILIVYLLGLQFGYWYLALIGLTFPLTCAFLMMFMPETPRWLMVHKSRHEAKSALFWLRESSADIEHELNDMEDSNDSSTNEMFQIMDFNRPELRKALLIAVGLMVFQQLSGINAVMFNIVEIFLDAGFRESGELAAVIVGAIQFIASCLSCLIIERWGRRNLLIYFGLVMSLSCFLFTFYYHLDEIYLTLMMKYIPLFSLSLFIIAFSLAWGPVPSLMMSEIFSTKARSTASSLTSLSNWLATFIITKNYMSMKNVMGKDGIFAFFGICTIFGSIFVHCFVPETKGKSLEDIELYFVGHSVNRGSRRV